MLRNILVPVVPIYQSVTWLRNYCYDKNILKSKSYDFPIICVGNLSVGGTGKTPMIEYLLRLLHNDYKVGTLSRGYGRKTSGFILADNSSTARTIGDEPFQFYHKFDNITVAVGENRQEAINEIKSLNKLPDILLLDDAFQHRKVKAGLNILLTTFDSLYVNDMLLPTGNLRESKSGAKRADMVVVTKCPNDMDQAQKTRIKNKLKLDSHQKLFFSTISYSDHLIGKNEQLSLSELEKQEFTLVTGIANPKPLVDYFSKEGFSFAHDNYKDHHEFTQSEIDELQQKEIIVTTEKDYVRLKDQLDNVFYLPIESKIFDSEAFDKSVVTFINEF